jgi:ABC-type transport system involved in multi-copper enzyme maturation permease subunit
MLQKTKGSWWGLSRAGLACLLAALLAVNALVWAGAALPPWATGTAWGVLGLGLLALLAPVWRPLFGPVLFYDLVRSTRRGRYAVLRCVYAAALLAMLFLFYARWTTSIWDVWSVQGIDRTKAAQFAEGFFHGFMTLQFVTAVLLTPALTAGAIAEEKERRTLEFLFTTDLYSHEIVFGKLLSRLAFLTLLLLTGLPVLSLLLFLGGVDPGLMLGGFAATALTMLSLASLSLLNSAYARKPLTATFLTYLQVLAYLVVSGYLAGLVDPLPAKRGPEAELVLAFAAGNIRVALAQLDLAAAGAGGVSAALPGVLRAYCAFHGLVTLVSLLGATLPLRLWVRQQASRGARRAFVLALTQRRLPRVSDRPMIWKEVFAEPTFRFNRTGMVFTATFLSVCLIIATFIEICLFVFGITFGDLDVYMNRGARTIGTFFACLLLLGVAVRAAGSFSGERDRQTLLSLLGTPLEGHEILGAKWLGSIVSGRKVWWYLAGIWLAALLTGGLHPIALPLLVVAWACYALFLASLGLWFSLVSRNTLRATIWTMLTVLGTCVAPWLLSSFWMLVLEFLHPSPYRAGWGPLPSATRAEPGGWTVELSDLLAALAPPSSLNFLTFYDRDFQLNPDPFLSHQYGPPAGYGQPVVEPWVRLLAIVFGLVCYVVAGLVLYAMACARFPDVTGRMPLARGRPHRPARRSA